MVKLRMLTAMLMKVCEKTRASWRRRVLASSLPPPRPVGAGSSGVVASGGAAVPRPFKLLLEVPVVSAMTHKRVEL